MTTAESFNQIAKQFATIDMQASKIAEQAAEIERLKKLLAARPTEMQLVAATTNANYYRDLFTKADKARKSAQRKLRTERDFADFVVEKHNGGEGVA